MSNSTVGIKIANGEFFPILDENSRGNRKKLVLTTVKDNQESVQIDLYRGEGKSLAEAAYIGSLVVENIRPAAKGDQDIELIVGVDREGNLNASAGDIVTGERQSLSISLESLGEGETYDIPDFELDETLAEIPEEEEIEPMPEKKRAHPLLLIGFVILGLAIIVLIAFLIFKTFQGPQVPPLQAGEKTSADAVAAKQEEPKAETAAPEPVKTAAVEKPAVDESVSEEPAVETSVTSVTEEEASSRGSPPEEIWYKIKRGDTLWDISDSFYRSPWFYGKIAEDNDITNPDIIFADTNIHIPSQ